MCLGSLREQILFPKVYRNTTSEKKSDEDIREALRRANLWYVFERFGQDLERVEKWSEVLSIGEQQRVAFARIFFHRPQFVVLDEVNVEAFKTQRAGKLIT